MSTTGRDAALAAEIEGAMDERLTDAERAELGPDYEAACIRYERCVEACNEAEAEVEAEGERVVARLLRERDAARAEAAKLRAALEAQGYTERRLSDKGRAVLDRLRPVGAAAERERDRALAERDEARAELYALATAARQSACVVIPVRPGGPYAAVRSRKHRGTIELPGGKVEPGETPYAAARREVREELGVEMVSERIIPLGTFLHVFEGQVWCAHAFLGDIAGAHLGEGDAGETTWATREELLAGTYGAVVARIFAALGASNAGRMP